ncbi:MAG: LysM domain-containing protein [Clostridia bacterium]
MSQFEFQIFPDDNQPAQPGAGPEGLPTPALPDSLPAQPGEGPIPFPTPALPGRPPIMVPIRRCPYGYRAGMVDNNQTFTDLLLENNVSYQAMRYANPNLPTTRLAPGTRYCAPPAQSRALCENGYISYVMELGETLYALTRKLGVSPEMLLVANPTLAPSDFIPGRVICVP